MQYVLYTIPASHYCEKARWVLDFKGLVYEEVGWVPLWHFLKVKRLPVKKTSVPILQVGKEYIQDSAEIFRYLEAHHPKSSLLPKNKSDQKELWEINQEMELLGRHVRRWIYGHVLPYSSEANKILAYEASVWQAKAFEYSYPIMKMILTKGLALKPDKIKHSEERIYQGLDKLEKRLKAESFLLGGQFSFADLTAASILCPLARPPEHPIYSKIKFIDEIEKKLKPFQNHPTLKWVLKMYREWR